MEIKKAIQEVIQSTEGSDFVPGQNWLPRQYQGVIRTTKNRLDFSQPVEKDKILYTSTEVLSTFRIEIANLPVLWN